MLKNGLETLIFFSLQSIWPARELLMTEKRFRKKSKKKKKCGLFLLLSFSLVSQNQTLFNEVIAVPLSHIPSWVQHLEKLKTSMHQIIPLKLLFIAGHFVLSSPWQNVKAVLSVAFSLQHLQGSDTLPLCYSGEDRRMVGMKAASQTAGTGSLWCCIAVVPSVRDQVSHFSAIWEGFLSLLTSHTAQWNFCAPLLSFTEMSQSVTDGVKLL